MSSGKKTVVVVPPITGPSKRVPGAEAVARDAPTGDTFTLTGSGDVKPAERDAAGGGTIVHHFAATGVEAAAVYVVTAFIDWNRGGGELLLVDGIGHATEASAGVLKMAIRIFLPTGAFADAILTVNGLLPGASINVQEGIELSIIGTPFLHMRPDGGGVLLHVQKLVPALTWEIRGFSRRPRRVLFFAIQGFLQVDV